jgi:predicted SAM-dependent methyltransferase
MLSEVKALVKDRVPFIAGIVVPVVQAARHQTSRRKIRRILKERGKVSVELGAGGKKGQGEWVTIDLSNACDIYWDLRKGIPFPSESVRKIYSSHFFEHLSFRQADAFLEECKRVLIPAGVFSICVPNARIYLEAYCKGAPLSPSYFVYQPAYNHTTLIDCVNYMAYMDGHHKQMFDEDKLLFVLRSKGFKNVRLRPFDPSLDLEARDYESIYGEAEKG